MHTHQRVELQVGKVRAIDRSLKTAADNPTLLDAEALNRPFGLVRITTVHGVNASPSRASCVANRSCIIERGSRGLVSVTEHGKRGIFRVDIVRRALRTAGYSAWLFSAVLALAAGALALWIFPALGAVLFAAALATLYVLVQQLYRTPVPGGLVTCFVISIATLLLTLLLVASLRAASG